MLQAVELCGGPLAGCQWPVRAGVDRTLWIGIGADGGEYDGRHLLAAIAVYQRAGGEDSTRYSFARLEGADARLAELGRRLTNLRAQWDKLHVYPRPFDASHEQLPAFGQQRLSIPPGTPHGRLAAGIAGFVVDRWRRELEAIAAGSPPSEGQLRIEFVVPGEAEHFASILAEQGIAAAVESTTTHIERGDSGNAESCPTGNVLFHTEDLDRIFGVLASIARA